MEYDYVKEIRRQWEVNIYNDLGFICNGSYIEETNRGYKNENREATSLEGHIWSKFYYKTPVIPIVQMPDNIDLTSISELPIDVESKSFEGKFIWVKNKHSIVLLQKRQFPSFTWKVEYSDEDV